ncbi:methylated-DNA--[protein]-cysteine S-methyltransferase [Dietzia sp. 179-F 9C3 NHS]|uniref:methylated-DNA--[protein]-cysteine S-methyltransferase n=1 Tax=Dietzia sp. 179-F 9C3 NHS TaxID=3374295 RepID=UPI00387919A5
MTERVVEPGAERATGTEPGAAYRVVGSPIGDLLLAATPRGLAYVGFEVEDTAALPATLAAHLGASVRRDDATEAVGLAAHPDPAAGVLDDATGQIVEYLDGRRRAFDLPLDTALSTGFRGQVQAHLATIPYGHTATYTQLATDLGRPGAVRAVGTACATNPLPLVWPCHRVLRSDGGLGGFRGGLEVKQRLLALEAAG